MESITRLSLETLPAHFVPGDEEGGLPECGVQGQVIVWVYALALMGSQCLSVCSEESVSATPRKSLMKQRKDECFTVLYCLFFIHRELGLVFIREKVCWIIYREVNRTIESSYTCQAFCKLNIFTAIILFESGFCFFLCWISVCIPVSLETHIKPLPLNYSEISRGLH